MLGAFPASPRRAAMLPLPGGRKIPGKGEKGEGRSSAPRHPPELGWENGEAAAPLLLSVASNPRQHQQPARHMPLSRGMPTQIKFPGTRKNHFASKKPPARSPRLNEEQGLLSISRRHTCRPAKRPSWRLAPGAAHQGCATGSLRAPGSTVKRQSNPCAQGSTSSGFAESQMLHPSQTSPGYNAHLEIPR